MNFGIFIRANYQDGLKLGNVVDGLVGCVLIKDVPNDYTEADLETLVICNGLGFKFGSNLHDNVLLAEANFPSNCRFNTEVAFGGCVRGAIQELTKQRIARQRAA